MAAPEITSKKLTLSYPVQCCDFDHQDANKLIVGGGGGAGRSGVGNKIVCPRLHYIDDLLLTAGHPQSILDTSSPEEIKVVSEIDLSREEDSVTTLAVGLRKHRTTLVYTGINSSVDDIQKGKNEHFRVFGIDPPAKSKAESIAKITELSKTSIFESKDADAFQRLLRLAPPYSSTHQIGAIATGFAKDPEIAVFEVSTTAGVGPKIRGKVEPIKEAMDLDILQVDEDKWQLAYCDDYDLYLQDVGKDTQYDPIAVFNLPDDIATGQGRPQFRCIRYLTPNFLLAVSNLPKGSGAVLQGFRLPASSAEQRGFARLSVSAKLPKNVARATGLAVRNLSPTTTPGGKQGDAQFVVAIAGQDRSISLYTLEHQSVATIELIVKLYPIATFKDVHPSPITGLAFNTAPILPPRRDSTSSEKGCKGPKGPKTLQLASVGSMGNTVVIHTIPLKREGGPAPRPIRYVVAVKSHGPSITSWIIFSAIGFAIIGAILQGFMEIKGLTPSVIGARYIAPTRWVTPIHTSWHGAEDLVVKAPEEISTTGTGGLLTDLLLGQVQSGSGKVVLSADGEVKVDEHDAERHADAKEWEELPAAQRIAWKKALRKAGHWGEEMGETIFKGVLFSEIGGAIGNMVAG